MFQPFAILFGKSLRSIVRLRSGGSAYPGLVMEKLAPSFVKDSLSQLPYGVVVISGTNGKTTTTKMVVSLLEKQGLRVFTNRSGSNFVRGIAAALLAEVTLSGKLKADIAVLELDEAHAVKFVEQIPPTHSLFLNVLRDQLDRFGEIDTTAQLLAKVASVTAKSLILNREDPRVRELAKNTDHAQPVYFGVDASLRSLFLNDEELHAATHTQTLTPLPDASVVLHAIDGPQATFLHQDTPYSATLKISGVHNQFNAAGALALCHHILPDVPFGHLVDSLSEVTPAFGRGEEVIVHGTPVELVLVKNPSGFRLSLHSQSPGRLTMIAINDNYADGRDMSWLWDVSFSHLSHVSVVSGIRAYDMALRLEHDDVHIDHVNPQLHEALASFLAIEPATPKRIYCTYTAMLAIRTELAKIADVEEVL